MSSGPAATGMAGQGLCCLSALTWLEWSGLNKDRDTIIIHGITRKGCPILQRVLTKGNTNKKNTLKKVLGHQLPQTTATIDLSLIVINYKQGTKIMHNTNTYLTSLFVYAASVYPNFACLSLSFSPHRGTPRDYLGPLGMLPSINPSINPLSRVACRS